MTLTFKPDWVSPPGDTIADLLEEKDWTQAQLAEKLEYTVVLQKVEIRVEKKRCFLNRLVGFQNLYSNSK